MFRSSSIIVRPTVALLLIASLQAMGCARVGYVDSPCAGQDCSEHGECLVAPPAQAICACDEGYVRKGWLSCVPASLLDAAIWANDANAGVDGSWRDTGGEPADGPSREGGVDGAAVEPPHPWVLRPGVPSLVPAGFALDSDGSAVLAATALGRAGGDFMLLRLSALGEADPSFGVDGRVVTDLGAQQDVAHAIARLGDGRLVVAGETAAGDDHDHAIACYRADGSLDPSFGAGGLVRLGISTRHTRDDRALAVDVDPAGRVVVAGYYNSGEVYQWEDFSVLRLLPDGSADPSFGSSGVVRLVRQGADFPVFVHADAQGRVLVGGGSTYDIYLARLLESGALDPGFGAAGVVVTTYGGADTRIHGFYAQPDGAILVLGRTGPTTSRSLLALRYLADGALDAAFGTGGIETGWSGSTEWGRAAVADARGDIWIAGRAHDGLRPVAALMRLRADGSIDTDFGDGGRQLLALGGGGSDAWDLQLDAAGQLRLLVRAGERLALLSAAPGSSRLELPQPEPDLELPFASQLPLPETLNDVVLSDTVVDAAVFTREAPFSARVLQVSGTVRHAPGGPSAMFLRAAELRFAAGAALRVDGEVGGSQSGTTPGSGGAGGSGGGSGCIGHSGYSGYGGRFGWSGQGSCGALGGKGWALEVASDFFYGLGGDGASGRACCPPLVPGGDGVNGGGGGGAGTWNNVSTPGGGGGGGLLVAVAGRITGPGSLTAQGGPAGPGANGAFAGSGGGGVIWVAAEHYDGQLSVSVSGGSPGGRELGTPGTARIFEILPDGSLVERAFTDTW